MSDTAKIFANGRSQAVRLPSAYRFKGDEVYIRRDPATGDVILSEKPNGWGEWLEALRELDGSEDFLTDRDQGVQDRDPLSDPE